MNQVKKCKTQESLIEQERKMLVDKGLLFDHDMLDRQERYNEMMERHKMFSDEKYRTEEMTKEKLEKNT